MYIAAILPYARLLITTKWFPRLERISTECALNPTATRINEPMDEPLERRVFPSLTPSSSESSSSSSSESSSEADSESESSFASVHGCSFDVSL